MSGRVVLLCLLFARVAHAQSVVTPPSVATKVDAVLPPDVLQPGAQANVDLRVTIDPTGTVTEAVVETPGIAALDDEAVRAVKLWTFTPAMRDGQAIASRIRVTITFTAPAAAPATPPVEPPPTPPPVAPPTEPNPPVAPPTEPTLDATVRGHARPKDRGASTIDVDATHLSANARSTPGKILEQAAGLFLANEGGAGHADQVFLRGFDAEQGQDIEFTVNGVPINEVDNTDGHGYADTHFIIPEVVRNLHVVEGPFDPHQGDFSVAGSADYELGVLDRGLQLEETFGSFQSQRTVLVWAPKGEHEGTFGAMQFSNGAGYGVNRAATEASAMAEYEGELGKRGLWRVLATLYGTHYKAAGVVRADDVAAGTIDFYGTEDPSQGGDAQRYSLSFDLEDPLDTGTLKQQVFLTYRTLHIIENFTGFLLDTPELGQSTHPQRGDAIDQDYEAFTLGARGSYRQSAGAQSLEVGYYARYDHTIPEIQRLRFGTEIPYAIDSSLVTNVVNVAGYVDLDLHPTRWLTLRGGLRQEFFGYDVLRNCATDGNYSMGRPLNVSCPEYDPSGPRLPSTRVTATGIITEPKVTALFQLPAGLSATGSYGVGAQSMDALYLSQDENAPFSTLKAGEAGVLYHLRTPALDLSARAVGYYTHVDENLIFNPNLGRLAESTGTTRRGAVVALHAATRWLNELASFTYAYATYDDDGTLVPYVPSIVARSDTSIVHDLPYQIHGHALVGTAGLGLNFVGKRALPLGQFADPTFTMDASIGVRWRWIKLGLQAQNILNDEYPLSEFFFASDFHSRAYPTLAPAPQFTAAPPRIFLFTVGLALDDEANR